MKTNNKLCVLLALVLALLCCVLAQAEESAFAADMRLERAEGSVRVTNQNGRDLSLREGMKLYHGYGVATGEASCAYIRLDGDRVIKLDANTNVTIRKEDKRLELTLERGGLFFDIGAPLQEGEELNVRTTTMVTGIRGTSGMILHFEQEDIQALLDYWQLYSESRPLQIEDLLTGDGSMLTFIGVMDGQVETTTADGQTWPIAAGEAGVIVIDGDRRMIFFDMTADDVPLFVGVEIIEGSELWERISDELSRLDAQDIAEAVQNRLHPTPEEALALPLCTCGDPRPYTVPALAAGCETAGFEAFERCEICGGRLGGISILPALGHDGVSLPYQSPTCTQRGLTWSESCARCGLVMTPRLGIQALGHAEVVEEAIVPTCTEPGRTASSSCTRCREVLVAPEAIPAQGHTETVIAAMEATCTTAGSTAGMKCAVCDETLTAPEVIPAQGHTETAIAAVEATCTTAGSTAGVKCATCGEILTAPEAIPAQGHTETAIAAVEATCTTAGSTAGVKCAVCGEILTAPEAIPAQGHTESAIAAVEATCTTAGSTAGVKCATCGEILTAPEVIPAQGHTETAIAAVEATCTTAGSTAGMKCAVCGEILTAPETIPALGHDMSEWVCDESVNMHYSDCMRDCGYSEQGECADDPENIDGYCDVCGGAVG